MGVGTQIADKLARSALLGEDLPGDHVSDGFAPRSIQQPAIREPVQQFSAVGSPRGFRSGGDFEVSMAAFDGILPGKTRPLHADGLRRASPRRPFSL